MKTWKSAKAEIKSISSEAKKELDSKLKQELAIDMKSVQTDDYRFVRLTDRIKKITFSDHKTLEQRALKTAEETGEMAQAVLSYLKASGSSYKNLGKDNVIEEAADVMICAMSMAVHTEASEYGDLSISSFLDIIEKKIAKWEEKVAL